MEYGKKLMGSIGVGEEDNGYGKFGITVSVDTLQQCNIKIEGFCDITITEDDVDALRALLHNASIQLMKQRNMCKQSKVAV